MRSHSREATVVQSQSRSDCYPILLNMQRHSREASVMPRRRGEAASCIIKSNEKDSICFGFFHKWTASKHIKLDVKKVFRDNLYFKNYFRYKF